jgi:peptidase M28-like protein
MRSRIVMSLAIVLLIALGAATAAVVWMTRMPGRSHPAALPPLTEEETLVRDRIAHHVAVLAGEIGERNTSHPQALHRAQAYLTQELTEAGYTVVTDPYLVGGEEVTNLEATLPGPGKAEGYFVVGAHYDSALGTPGANDNASGVAVVLELARLLRSARPGVDIRWLFFVNEEQPFFGTTDMGSRRYADRAAGRDETVRGMISVETVGYYASEAGTQQYPFPFQLLYPRTGNFVAFVSNLGSRALLSRCIGAFRRKGTLPSEGAALPGSLPGVGWSDQWGFWQQGYPAIMVTDTAFLRYPEYHRPTDTAERVDAARVARVVTGLRDMLLDLGHDAEPGGRPGAFHP